MSEVVFISTRNHFADSASNVLSRFNTTVSFLRFNGRHSSEPLLAITRMTLMRDSAIVCAFMFLATRRETSYDTLTIPPFPLVNIASFVQALPFHVLTKLLKVTVLSVSMIYVQMSFEQAGFHCFISKSLHVYYTLRQRLSSVFDSYEPILHNSSYTFVLTCY